MPSKLSFPPARQEVPPDRNYWPDDTYKPPVPVPPPPPPPAPVPPPPPPPPPPGSGGGIFSMRLAMFGLRKFVVRHPRARGVGG